jgi:hypothetical protein
MRRSIPADIALSLRSMGLTWHQLTSVINTIGATRYQPVSVAAAVAIHLKKRKQRWEY